MGVKSRASAGRSESERIGRRAQPHQTAVARGLAVVAPQVEPGRDYVLIVRPGLAEASEQRGSSG
jgi:hypothetical protein